MGVTLNLNPSVNSTMGWNMHDKSEYIQNFSEDSFVSFTEQAQFLYHLSLNLSTSKSSE